MVVLILLSVPLVVIPAILTLIMAATLQPLVRFLVRHGQSHAMATAVAVGGATAAIVAVLVLALVNLVDDVVVVGQTVMQGAGSVDQDAGGHLGLAHDAVRMEHRRPGGYRALPDR